MTVCFGTGSVEVRISVFGFGMMMMLILMLCVEIRSQSVSIGKSWTLHHRRKLKEHACSRCRNLPGRPMFRDAAARRLMERCAIPPVMYYDVSDCLSVYVRVMMRFEHHFVENAHLRETLGYNLDNQGRRRVSGLSPSISGNDESHPSSTSRTISLDLPVSYHRQRSPIVHTLFLSSSSIESISLPSCPERSVSPCSSATPRSR